MTDAIVPYKPFGPLRRGDTPVIQGQAASYLDRSAWSRGPWDEEPFDFLSWEEQGVKCMIHRNPTGAWCGYIGVPTEHAWHGADTKELSYVRVHGGVTFAEDTCREPNDNLNRDGRWWVGFDCGHGCDVMPIMSGRLLEAMTDFGSTYRDAEYAIAEVRKLLAQAMCR